MSSAHKVVWSEGMFLGAQHLQQFDRHVEHLVESRCGRAMAWLWGFARLEIDQALLGQGRFSVRTASGIFPDGTPFEIPGDADMAVDLEVTDDMRDCEVMLCLPRRGGASVEFARRDGDAAQGARYRVRETMLADGVEEGGEEMAVETARLRLFCSVDPARRNDHECMSMGRVRQRLPGGAVELDRTFVPPTLDLLTSPGSPDPSLLDHLNELVGSMEQRAEALAGRRRESGGKTQLDVEQLLMLQTLNRSVAVFRHDVRCAALHPERLFREAVALCGELSTFETSTHMVPGLRAYEHDNPGPPFAELMERLRRLIRLERSERAVELEVRQLQNGFWYVRLGSAAYQDSGRIVMGVRASVTERDIVRLFPQQLSLGHRTLTTLVKQQLRGISVSPLERTPDEVNWWASDVRFFELDRSSGREIWDSIPRGKPEIGFFPRGNWPSLQVRMWVIVD